MYLISYNWADLEIRSENIGQNSIHTFRKWIVWTNGHWTVSSLKLFVLPPRTVILIHSEIVPLIQDQFCILHREYVGNFKI